MTRRLRLIPVLVLVAADCCCLAAADDRDRLISQKKEMEQIQIEMEQSRKQLDSLKAAELGLQQRVANYDQRIATNRKLINRLNRQAQKLNRAIQESEKELTARQEQDERIRRRYLGNLRQFYMASRRPNLSWARKPNRELEAGRRVAYLSALTEFESGAVSQASDLLVEAVSHLDQLAGESRKVSRLTRKKETATSLERTRKRQKEKELQKLRRKKVAETDRILTLRQAAAEMERIVERLEDQRRRQQAQRPRGGSTSVFATLKGQLAAPVSGKIIVPFGEAVDRTTNLRSFSPGITIQSKPNRNVRAVASGTVAYSGNLRGYGNFIIINHDDEYYTTYAGLGESSTVPGAYLPAGAMIGKVGDEGQLRFELRRGSEPLDPVKWIKIDSY